MKRVNLKIILLSVFILGLAGIAVFTALRLSQRTRVAPTAPESQPAAADDCSDRTNGWHQTSGCVLPAGQTIGQGTETWVNDYRCAGCETDSRTITCCVPGATCTDWSACSSTDSTRTRTCTITDFGSGSCGIVHNNICTDNDQCITGAETCSVTTEVQTQPCGSAEPTPAPTTSSDWVGGETCQASFTLPSPSPSPSPTPTPGPKTQCSDGIDNDGDTKIDCTSGNADPGCYPDGDGGGTCNPDDDNETDTPSGCNLSFTIAGATPTPSASVSPAPKATATPTATPTATITPIATPKATVAATATPIAAATPVPQLPDAGISTPTLVGLGLGTIILIFSLVLAL